MNKSAVIKCCGDMLTEIDVLRGSLFPGIPARKKLDSFRDTIDNTQLQLVDLAFKENTKQYKDISAKMENINKDIKKTIRDVDRVADTFETLSRFVTVLDEFLMIAVSIA